MKYIAHKNETKNGYVGKIWDFVKELSNHVNENMDISIELTKHSHIHVSWSQSGEWQGIKQHCSIFPEYQEIHENKRTNK